jgi:hypothetical protein
MQLLVMGIGLFKSLLVDVHTPFSSLYMAQYEQLGCMLLKEPYFKSRGFRTTQVKLPASAFKYCLFRLQWLPMK